MINVPALAVAVAVSTLFLSAAASAQPQAASVAPIAAETGGAEPTAAPKKQCKKVEITGTRLVRKVCKTPAEWAAESAQTN